MFWEDLERDDIVLLRIPGSPHLAHATATEEIEQPKPTEGGPLHSHLLPQEWLAGR
jgi:hypothetical protein